MQDHAADQLYVKRSQAEHAAGAFAHDRKGRNEQIVERLAVRQLLAKLDCFCRQLLV